MNKDSSFICPPFVEKLMSRLSAAGFEVYVVGGAVRDHLMGFVPHDYDLTTSALPEDVIALFSDMRTVPTGIKHGTVSVISDSHAVEITTFRLDGGYSDGRHPDKVSFSKNIADDLARRDLTVNALAWSPSTGVVDLFGGKSDIENRIVRAVGDPHLRFTEDALRILRAFRFAARLDFSIENETFCAAARLKDRLSLVSVERIAAELCGLLLAKNPSPTLHLMKNSGVLSAVMPDIDIPDENIAALSRLADGAILEVRLGRLLRGVAEARGALCRLRLSNRTVNAASEIALAPLPQSTDGAALRRFAASYSSAREIILCASDGETLAKFDAVMAASPPLRLSDLAIGGIELSRLGLSNGKEIGKTLGLLLDAVLDDPQKNTADELIRIAQGLAKEKK